MSLRVLSSSVFVVVVLSLGGCPSPESTPDAFVADRDAFVVEQDAPPVVTDDTGVPVDAHVVATDDTGTMMADPDAFVTPDAVTVPATWTQVHTALQSNCTPCHVSIASGGHNMAQADEMAAYTDSQLSATACAGLTKGACAAMRVRAGSMPPGGGLPEPTRSEVAALLDGWVAAGQPAP
ncbi:MAG: hypothetical protein J0L92_18525 [Deltaproteobacteria bacterium]|nr:hypothetical protein [Deltaproteobacteria bacterium]